MKNFMEFVEETLEENQLDNLSFCEEYAEYIMNHGAAGDHPCGNGDALILLMEDQYLFEEFLEKYLENDDRFSDFYKSNRGFNEI